MNRALPLMFLKANHAPNPRVSRGFIVTHDEHVVLQVCFRPLVAHSQTVSGRTEYGVFRAIEVLFKLSSGMLLAPVIDESEP